MASTKNTKLTNAKSQLDAKYGNWAGDYVEKMIKSWKTLDDVKKSLSNWTYKSSDTNYTPYTSLTGKKATQNTNPGWTGRDLSYVKPTNYYWSWIDWDYGADISKDNNRAKQMAYNLKSDMKTNPWLFANRADYDQYYHYSDRSDSQKKMLDEFFDNANKYDLGSTDNLHADMASEASTDKNKKILAKDAATYNKMLPYLDEIRNTINDRLTPLFDNLLENQTKYLQDMAYLRKLQMQYNKGMVEEANSRAAGQSASLWTMMSGQWLSQSAIASSMFWAEEQWVKELNRIQDQHIERMRSLADAEKDFKNNYVDMVKWLTTTQVDYLDKWYNSFKALQDWLDNSYKTLITEKYSPYEELTRAKVSWAAEAENSYGKQTAKQTQYQNWDAGMRRTMLYNNIWAVISDEATMAKLIPYIDQAASSMSDYSQAVNYVVKQLNNKTVNKSNVNPTTVLTTVLNENSTGNDLYSMAFGS